MEVARYLIVTFITFMLKTLACIIMSVKIISVFLILIQ